jgi:parallel beta-helix repeat protein
MKIRSKRDFISISVVVSLISVCFFSFLIIENIMDEGSVSAKTIIVDKSGGGDYTKIQSAINNATSGDTISVWAGVYYENLKINKSITLKGNGTDETFINGSRSGDVVLITSDWVNVTEVTISYSGNSSWWLSDDAGIQISSAFNVYIYHVNCSFNLYGIYLNFSSFNTIKDCEISNNEAAGIYSTFSLQNTVKNNVIDNNRYDGITLESSDSFKILNNNVTNNGDDGIELNWFSGDTIIRNNSVINNNYYGIWVMDSDRVIIENNFVQYNMEGIIIEYSNSLEINYNNCTRNSWTGVILIDCMYINISNNDIYMNRIGIECWEINNINFYNNSVTSNTFQGLIFRESVTNYIYNNTFMQCFTGISIVRSQSNFINNNNVSNNNNGIEITDSSSSNWIFDNIVSSNSVVGITIGGGANSNKIYHNLIIANSQQASDSGSNNWDYDSEGNYWSDYSGVDNGAGGRVPGDGIGDTNVPHPSSGFDNYPFIKKYGWLFPSIPILITESDLDPDGNYTVSWSNNSRSDGFVLEEDVDKSFNSPTIYTSGWVEQGLLNSMSLKNKDEGTYFYRIKSYNELMETDWSAIVNVTVDFPPRIPINLEVKPKPEGNALEISWDPNQADTVEYGLFYYNILNWELLTNLTHPTNHYDHTSLIDGNIYSYKVCAYDSRDQNSGFTAVVTSIPHDSTPPLVPTGLSAQPISETEIELEWDANTDPDLAGYNIYMLDPTADPLNEFQNIQVLMGDKTYYKVTGLTEQITYKFALESFDEVPNNSSFSEIVIAMTPDETHPQPPTGLTIYNATYNSLTLSWEPNMDSDIVGYYVYRSSSLTGTYSVVNSEPINDTTFVDSSLNEATVYYYKIKAMDDANLESLFSEPAYGITLLGPSPPVINNSIDDFELREDTYDDLSINLNHLFKDPNFDQLSFRCEGQDHINVSILTGTGKVILIPEQDWNGEEILTFYASDGISEISFEVVITVTPINDPPGEVVILKPEDGIEIKEKEILDFEGTCMDPDVLYGDVLTYTWSSSIDGEFGTGENLSGIQLSTGEHEIILEVNDKIGKVSSATISIDVRARTQGGGSDDKGDLSNIIWIAAGVVIVIIFLVILFLFLRRRQSKTASEISDEVEGQVLQSVVGSRSQISPGSTTEAVVPTGQPPGVPVTQLPPQMQVQMPYPTQTMYYAPQQIAYPQQMLQRPPQSMVPGQAAQQQPQPTLPPTGQIVDQPVKKEIEEKSQ